MTPPVSPPLPDAAARRSIEFRLDSTLFVEAGAGSGKTTALVSRIVRLVRSGACSLDELAAITFTEAAALELKVRVRQALAELARRGRDPAERQRATQALDGLEGAAITTIHGFCRRLLAEYPVEAGLPPRIEVLDDVARGLAWRRQFSAVLDRLGTDDAMRQLVGVASLIGVTPAHLETLALEVSEAWDRCGDSWPDVSAVLEAVSTSVSRGAAAVVAGVDEALSLHHRCLDADDALLVRLGEARELGELLRAASSELGLAGDGAGSPSSAGADPRLVVLASGQPAIKPGRFGRQEAWDCDIEDVRRRLTEVRERRQATLAEVADAVLPALVAALDVVAREAAAERRRSGRLVYHDLLVLTRDLLDDPGVLDDVRRRYRCLLVDELQDTDPLQLEIAERIGTGAVQPGATGSGAASPVADTAPLDRGRLFVVGDPKQSIYRFRGADPLAYEAARSRFGTDIATLTANFRSVPGILEFANACFPAVMGLAYSPLEPVRAPGGGDRPPVRLVGGPLDASLRRHEQRLLESEDCAAAIDRAVRREGWLVAERDGEGERLRAARLSDVAILVPRRTGLDELESALDARAIAYRVESASLVYRTQEVRDLLALCRAIDDPADQVALLATLRSPAFACRDDDLYAFRRAGGAWSIEAPPPAPEGGSDEGTALVAAALETLSAYRHKRFELGPVGVLEAAVRDRRLLQLAVGSPRQRESWRRVRFVLERARAFVQSGGGGLREFADWVSEQLSEGLRAVESVLPEPDEDAVHILTVHGAKGLEFPICVLAGFGTSDEVPRGTGRKVLRPPTGRPEVHLRFGLSTAGAEALRATELSLERDEAARVLYVAATRARDHLVVCAHHVPATGEAPAAQRLVEAAVEALETRPGLWERLEPGVIPDTSGEEEVDGAGPAGSKAGSGELPPARLLEAVSQTSFFDLSIVGAPGAGTGPLVVRPPAVTAADWQRWRHERRELLDRIGRRRGVRATEVPSLAGALAGALAVPASDERDRRVPAAGQPATDGRHGDGGAGTRLGRAVHATLGTVSLATARAIAAGGRPPAELHETATAEALAEGIGERAADVELLAAAALSSPTVRLALASRRPRRELYVATTVSGVLLDGYLDLCAEREGVWTIVDYKTDAVASREEAAEAAGAYALQVAAYAVALEDATALPVDRCVLVFLGAPGGPFEYRLEDLDELMATVRAAVGAA